MLGTDDSFKPSPEITRLYAQHSELKAKLDLLPRHLGDRNMYASGAKKYQTNLKNHLATNLPKMMKRYMRK